MKHLYEVECGAVYWVAADTIRQAVDALFQCWKDEGWDSDDELEIRDYGATISLRFGDQAREIVASIPSEAVKVLARMMFAEHARAEKLEAALRKGFEIDKVPEKRAKKLHVRDDGLDIRTPMNEAAAAAKKPTVIACSEWP